jgi:protein TonB
LLLLWVMQALVGVEGKLGEESTGFSVDFVRLRRDTEPEVQKRKPPKKAKPEQPPPPPIISAQTSPLKQGDGMEGIAPEIAKLDTSSLVGGGGSDRDIVPLVRIEPDYPVNARERGIEGWVVVKFTVTKIGSVEDAAVVSAHPGRIFDRSALRAVQKWRYNPKIENGKAIARPGVQVRLDFYMDD